MRGAGGSRGRPPVPPEFFGTRLDSGGSPPMAAIATGGDAHFVDQPAALLETARAGFRHLRAGGVWERELVQVHGYTQAARASSPIPRSRRGSGWPSPSDGPGGGEGCAAPELIMKRGGPFCASRSGVRSRRSRLLRATARARRPCRRRVCGAGGRCSPCFFGRRGRRPSLSGLQCPWIINRWWPRARKP